MKHALQIIITLEKMLVVVEKAFTQITLNQFSF